jgi:hypothetical protein
VAARLGPGARLRAKELHQLVGRHLRRLPQRGGEAGDELEVVFRVPVRRLGLDGAPQLFLGARQPAELLVGLPVASALRVEREAGPEVRRGGVGRG